MKAVNFVALALIFALSFLGGSNSVLTTFELSPEVELSERFDDSNEKDADSDTASSASLFEKILYAQNRNQPQNSCNDRSIPHCPYHSQAPPHSFIL